MYIEHHKPMNEIYMHKHILWSTENQRFTSVHTVLDK